MYELNYFYCNVIPMSVYGPPGRPSLQEIEFFHALPLSLMGVPDVHHCSKCHILTLGTLDAGIQNSAQKINSGRTLVVVKLRTVNQKH